jgi:hypothetical protein
MPDDFSSGPGDPAVHMSMKQIKAGQMVRTGRGVAIAVEDQTGRGGSAWVKIRDIATGQIVDRPREQLTIIG